MPELRTKAELSALAKATATTQQTVAYRGRLYLPVNIKTNEVDSSTEAEHLIWMDMDDEYWEIFSNTKGILFATPAEFYSFKYMIKQVSKRETSSLGMLVATHEDDDVVIKVLTDTGELMPATGKFTASYMPQSYTPNLANAEKLFATISEWVGSTEQAHSLLYHLATMLQPGFSAVKYVLLIGEGRNGKGTLLSMLEKLIGSQNISHITRQTMADKGVELHDLNGKLLNIVYDGPKEFVKDSSYEKTLIAGEPVSVRPLYSNTSSDVQTNALFIEALNQEPKVSDKSTALQARMVRFNFPNTYAKDLGFEAKMLSEEMLSALFELLLQHWVNKDELAEKLALTAASLDLQMVSEWNGSPLLLFIEYTAGRDNKFLDTLESTRMGAAEFRDLFRPWMENNGYRNVELDYLDRLMADYFRIERKTVRIQKKPTTRSCIVGLKPTAQNAVSALRQNGNFGGESSFDAAVLAGMEEE